MAVRLELKLIDASDLAPVPDTSVRVETQDLSVFFSSDSQGIAQIELPEAPRHLGVHIQREGFVPKLVGWDLNLVKAPWPERYTLKMERARTIGGVVRNQSGNPVAGANVLVTLRGGSPQAVQPRIYNDIYESAVTTDAEGRWQYPYAPEDLSVLWVRLEHPDYVSNEHIPALPPAEDFKNGTAVLTLLKGVPCEGIVTDELGQPLEGVKVILGEDGADSTSKPNRRTDGQGRFQFGGITFQSLGEPMVLSFNKNGFSPELIELVPASSLVSIKAVLRPGKTLRVLCTDSEGAPVPGVVLAMTRWRKHRPFNRHFKSDETGMAVWENAPPDEVEYCILRDGFKRDEIKLTANDQVQPIILRRPMVVSGQVIDARTKQPIPHFSLVLGRYFPERQGGWWHWIHSWVYPFTNGEYRCGAGDPVTIKNRDGSNSEEGFRRIRLSAPGYLPAISRPIGNDEIGETVCDFELEPAEELNGSVRDAQGNPAAGVDIVIATNSGTLIVDSGRLNNRGDLALNTDADGGYTLPPQSENFLVAIAHPQSGYFLTSYEELKASPDVTLLPWGRVELQTTSTSESLPQYSLQEHNERGCHDDRIRFRSSTIVAGNGLVIFEGLPAGRMRLYTSDSSILDGEIILVEAGQVVRMDRRAGRRTIVGQILLPPEGVSIEAPLARLHISRRLPTKETMDIRNRNEFIQVPFKIDFEGKFRIHDVPPGHYKLSAIFFKTMPRGQVSRSDIAGVAAKDFELPSGDGDFDLGILPFISPSDVHFG